MSKTASDILLYGGLAVGAFFLYRMYQSNVAGTVTATSTPSTANLVSSVNANPVAFAQAITKPAWNALTANQRTQIRKNLSARGLQILNRKLSHWGIGGGPKGTVLNPSPGNLVFDPFVMLAARGGGVGTTMPINTPYNTVGL